MKPELKKGRRGRVYGTTLSGRLINGAKATITDIHDNDALLIVKLDGEDNHIEIGKDEFVPFKIKPPSGEAHKLIEQLKAKPDRIEGTPLNMDGLSVNLDYVRPPPNPPIQKPIEPPPATATVQKSNQAPMDWNYLGIAFYTLLILNGLGFMVFLFIRAQKPIESSMKISPAYPETNYKPKCYISKENGQTYCIDSFGKERRQDDFEWDSQALAKSLLHECESGSSKVYLEEDVTVNGAMKRAKLICLVEDVK